MNRYAAKLLFQFRVTVDGEDGKRRICEERIILLEAKHAKHAVTKAKQRGREGKHTYKTSDGNRVRFEFVGVLELIQLGSECEPDEVWYEIRDRLTPSERKEKLIPPESELRAVRNENDSIRYVGVR